MPKNRRTTKSATVPQNTPQIIPEIKQENDSIVKRHTWNGIKYFTQSAFETALQNVWGIVGGGILTVATAIAVYIWSGQAEWLYPYLKHSVVFFSGMFSLIAVILFFTFIKLRKEKALEKAKKEKFISNEKGLLDHRLDSDKAQKEFSKILFGIGKELGRIGETTTNAGAKLEFWDKISLSLSRKSASKTAAKLKIYASELEGYLTSLVDVITVMNESVSFLLLNGGIKKDFFDAVQLALVELLNKTQISYASLVGFREAQLGVIGISQDLNTAINQLIFVTDGILGALKQAEETWERLIGIIDEIKNETTQLHS